MKKKLLIPFVLSFFFLLSAPAQNMLGTMKSGKTIDKRVPTTETGLVRQVKKQLQSAPAKAVSDPNAPTIFGFNHKTEDWSTPSPLPAGIYSFQATSPLQLAEVNTTSEFPATPQIAFYAEGKFYLLNMVTAYDEVTWEVKAQSTLYIYNAGSFELEGTEDLGNLYPMQCATYNPATKKVYFFAWDADFNKELCAMDLSTYEVEHLGNTDQFFVFIAAKSDGTMYAHSVIDGNLYSITTAGEYSIVGQSTISIQNGTSPAEAFFDASSGNLYVVAQLSDFSTHLYTVDTTTAQYTEIDQFPGGEHMRGIFTIAATAGAPKAVENISYQFTDDALSQLELSFDMPAQNSEGEALTGTLQATLTVDGEETDFEAAAAEHVVRTLTLARGEHKIQVVVSNDNGSSPERSFKVFAGQDVPGAVGNAVFDLDLTTNTAKVSWEAPTTSMHGGALDFTAIYYKVTRMPGSVVVADNLTATTFEETIPEARAHYYYNITACTADGEGVTVATNQIAYGSYYELPFADDFSSEEDFNTYTIVDGNGDGSSWTVGWWGGVTSPNSWGSCDEYLITPQLHGFKAGQAYRLTFIASGGCFEDWNGQPGTAAITAYLATTNQITGEETLLRECPVLESDKRTFSTVFDVPADGNYYIVLRCTGYSQENITLYSLSIDFDADPYALAAATNVVLTAGAQGELTNKLTFNAPASYRDDRAEMPGKMDVNIYKTIDLSEPVKTFTDVEPGQELTYEESDLMQGVQTYFIRAFAEGKMGERYEVSNFVGIDMPQMVTGFKVTMPVDGISHLTWDASPAAGQYGGYTGDVTYTIKRLNTYAFDWDPTITYTQWDVIADGISGTTFDDDTYGFTASGQQEYAQYGIYPVSMGGTNHGVTATSVIGMPYDQPYAESFSQEGLDTWPWVLHNGEGQNGWNVAGASSAVQPFDEDGGQLAYTNSGIEPTSGYIQSPRISLKGDAPALTFFMYHGIEADEEDATITVQASVDDSEWTSLATFDYNDGTLGWKKQVVDLSQFSGKGNITFQFLAYTADGSATLYIDNIVVDKYAEYDLAVQEYDIPVRLNIGQKPEAKVTVNNSGSKTAEGWQVVLKKNGEAIAQQDGTALESNAVKAYSFAIENTITEAGDSATYAIDIVFEADQKPENNSTGDVAAYINGPKYPFVANVQGTEHDGFVDLTWTKPDAEMTDPVLDDFESYEAFIIDGIGDWTVYDGDKDVPIYFGGPEVPNVFTPMAFWVWNRDEAGFQNFDVLAPHSGMQELMAFTATDGESMVKPNDNWIISPEVAPMSDVTFWVKESQLKYGPETFEVLYTSEAMPEDGVNDAFLASFQKLGDQTVDFVNWHEVGYTLPADARHFAIHHNTQENGMVLMLDDITYTPLYGGTTTLSLVGYNVYRDGVLLAEKLAEPAFTDDDVANGEHFYQVSAVWTIGESILSEPFVVSVATGIRQMADSQAKVYGSVGMIVIENAQRQAAHVFSADGKSLFRGEASAHTSIPARKGIYMVTVGERSYKVEVK